MSRKFLSVVAAFAVLVLPAGAFAHVVVKPGDVATGARQVFTVGVPNESETAQVVGLRLVIPEGLESVRPNAKAGWTITLKKTGEGETAKVTEINWAGGSVPVDQRDEFLFQAKAPANEGELKWKAYETYSDGKVVAWDQEPSEKEGSKPYSVTKVKKEASTDATGSSDTHAQDTKDTKSQANLAVALAGLSLVVAVGAMVLRPKK